MKKILTVFTLFSCLVLLFSACLSNDEQSQNKDKEQQGEQYDDDQGNGETDKDNDNIEDTDEPKEQKELTSFSLNWDIDNANFNVNGVTLGESRENIVKQLGEAQEVYASGGYITELYLIEEWFTRELAITYKEEEVVRIELFGSIDGPELEQLIESYNGMISRLSFASYSHLFESTNGNILVIESSNYAKYGVQHRYILTSISDWMAEGNYVEDYIKTDKATAIATLVHDNPLYIHTNKSGNLVANGIKIGDEIEEVVAQLGEPKDAVEDKDYEDQEGSDHGYWPHSTYYYSFETERNTIELVVEFYQRRVIAIEFTDEMALGLIPKSFVENFNGELFSNNLDEEVFFVESDAKFVLQASLGKYRIAERADRHWINASFRDIFEVINKEKVVGAPYIRN